MDTARVEYLIEQHGEPQLRTTEPLLYAVDYGDRIAEETLPPGSFVHVIGHDDSGYYLLETEEGDEVEGVVASQLEEPSS